MQRAQPDGDPAQRRHRSADLLQGQIGLFGDQLQNPRTVLPYPGPMITAHCTRPRMSFRPPPLRPPDGTANTHLKPRRRRSCTSSQRHKADHTVSQILRIRCWHIDPNSIYRVTLADQR